MIIKFTYIFIFSLLFILGCNEKNTKESIIKVKKSEFTKYSSEDSGLVSNKILSLLCENTDPYNKSKFKLWVGTNKGLNTFDGTNWELFTTKNSSLKSNIIYCILKDYKKRLWIGTEYGISCYDSGKWITVDIGRVLTICITINKCYFGTASGIYELNGKLSGKNLKQYTRENSALASKELSSESEKIISSIIDPKNNVWFGTGDGLIKLDDKHWQIFFGDHRKVSMFGSISKEAGNCPLVGNRIRVIKLDNSGNFWIGSNGGVNVLNPLTGIWKHSFSADRKVSSNKNGKFRTKILKGNSQLASPWINDIDFSDGNVWIATSKGLNKFKNGNWKTLKLKDGLPSNRILSLSVNNKDIFVGTDNGLCWIH